MCGRGRVGVGFCLLRVRIGLVVAKNKRGAAVYCCMSIVRDEGVLGGEPRIDGTRVGVRHVAARVVESGQSPAYVADQLDVSLAAVYEALSYYYEHIEEVRDFQQANESAFDRVRESSLEPRETIQ